MNRQLLRATFGMLLITIGVGSCLFFDQLSHSSGGVLGSVGRETLAVFRDPGTQWMVFLCVWIYFVTFTILGAKIEKPEAEKLRSGASRFQRFSLSGFQHLFRRPDLWLCGLLLIAALAYAFDYERASTSTQALVLVAGAAIGKGVRLWASWHAERGARHGEPGSKLETWNLKLGTLLSVWLLLLSVASLWHPEGAMQFQYRGLNRWSGPWDNPNSFGMLMGVGVVLACGLAVARFKFHVSSLPVWRPWVWRMLLLGCAGCCGVGLLKSYSRGAWLGTAVGLAVLGFQNFRCLVSGARFVTSPFPLPDRGGEGGRIPRSKGPCAISVHQRQSAVKMGGVGSLVSRFLGWLGRNFMPLAILLASLLVLAFWEFRYTEFHPVRRAFSVGNKNDFSWRNRIAAWEGSLAMMADKPLVGFGWNQPERVYDQFYRPPKVAEGMAIQLNHYFTLGMSLGLPALICFGMYVGLSLTGKAECGMQQSGNLDTSASARRMALGAPIPADTNTGQGCPVHPQAGMPALLATCRAGAVVLLVGLWFDGGLFNLATAAPLWALLELGRGARIEKRKAESGNVETKALGSSLPLIVALVGLLVTGLFWARARDPFHREWMSLKAPDVGKLPSVVVMPKSGGPFPVVVWCHGSGGSAETSGETLRQFAAQGLAAVGFNYSQTNQVQFEAQFTALWDELAKKHWARSNSIAWVGNSLGAQRQLSDLVRHPERQPVALVRLNGGWVEELNSNVEREVRSMAQGSSMTTTEARILKFKSEAEGRALSVWIAHGENDEVFPASDARKVADALRAAGADVRLDVFPGRGHGFGEDQPLLIKAAAEFCARESGAAARVAGNVRPSKWQYWGPAALFGGGIIVWLTRKQHRNRESVQAARWLKVCAALAVMMAVLMSAAHLGLPSLRATPATAKLARHWCVRPELRADFDWLMQQSGANACRIRDVLENLNLAVLQRGQFDASLPENDWREFVLSSWIEGDGGDIGWRRELWETIQPRVRRETDATTAAQTVACCLRLRVSVSPDAAQSGGVSSVWNAGISSRSGFERLYVAALRSVGIPARLGRSGLCEFQAASHWQAAPRPLLPEGPAGPGAPP